MDTEFIRDNISRDKAFADMQMSIVNELKEIKAELLIGKKNSASIRIDQLIFELEEDAKITYTRFEVLEGGKR